jgi:hypothetical protein
LKPLNVARKKPSKNPLVECLDKPPGEQIRCIVEKTGNAIESMERSIASMQDRLNEMPTLDDIKRETMVVTKALDRDIGERDKFRGEIGTALKEIAEIRPSIKAIDEKITAHLRLMDKQERKIEERLKNVATKDDLKSFATKDDLKSFATKEDLGKQFDEIKDLLGTPVKKQ